MPHHMVIFSFQKYIVEEVVHEAPKLITVTHVRFKVTTCLYLSPSNRARSLSTLITVSIKKDIDPKSSRLGKQCLMYRDKYSNAL